MKELVIHNNKVPITNKELHLSITDEELQKLQNLTSSV